MAAASLRELADAALGRLRRLAGPGVEAELYLSRGEERSIELREGSFDGVHYSRSEGMGLRIVRDGRMGFASGGGLGLEALDVLFEAVSGQLGFLEPDARKSFPAPAGAESDPGLEASLWDETLFLEPLEGLSPRLREMEAEALRSDKRAWKVLRTGYSESRGEASVVNTRGVLTYERGASASVGMAALSREGDDIQEGAAYQSACRKSLLDFNKTAREGAGRAAALLGSRKLPSGRRAVIFDPWVAGEFLQLVAGLLSADQVQRGKSLLAGKRGSRVGSELVTFVDDPRLKGGLGSQLYDDEGCPTRTKTMIEAGVVKEYFYDTYTANKDGVPGNASAGRSSFKGLPSPASTNFYLAPGKESREEILARTTDGILVLDIMGMHMADPISGEFSVGVSGLAVQKGRLTHGVKGAMISGNILDLLGRVDAVGSDLTFYGGMGAPTFRIAHMTVA